MKKKRGRNKFNKYRKIIIIISSTLSFLPLTLRKKLLEHFRMTKGIKGIVIRYILIRSITKKCGDNVSVHPGVYLYNVENMEFGDNVSIHPMCYLECGNEGSITIGNDVSIAHGVTIMATSHVYKEIDIPIKDQPIESKAVVIHDNVWIGAKSTILYGRSIFSGSIIGANSVVTKDVKPNAIVAGIPATLIKERII